MFLRRKRLGLALGGGGARGMAHVGVLRVLEEHAIPIDVIAGTSMGALVGAAFACGIDTYEMEAKTEEFLESSIYQNSALKPIREIQATKKLSLSQKVQAFFKNRLFLAQAMFRPGMLQSEDFQAMIDYFLPDIELRQTRIPFRAVVTDLASGEPVVISEGPLRQAVMASCAVPGAVPPVKTDNMLLSDGGICNLVPCDVLRAEGAELVVAVSVSGEIRSEEDFSSAIDIYVRASDIMGAHLERCKLKEADVVIHPRVGRLHWTDFGLHKDLILEGQKAAHEKLHLLRGALPLSQRFLWKAKDEG